MRHYVFDKTTLEAIAQVAGWIVLEVFKMGLCVAPASVGSDRLPAFDTPAPVDSLLNCLFGGDFLLLLTDVYESEVASGHCYLPTSSGPWASDSSAPT